MYKKAEGTAFGWILGLISLVGVGILYIILNQALTNYIEPAFDGLQSTLSLTPEQTAEINEETTFYNVMWAAGPLFVFIIVIIWMVLNAIRKSREDMYA